MRRLTGFPLLLGSLLLLTVGTSQRLAAQDDARVRELIREGIALHDKKMYDEALEKYQEAQAIDSTNPTLLYEMGFTCSAMGDDRKSLEIALLGTTLDSPLRGAFYMMVGTAYDHLGKPEKAVDAYEEGIERMPDDGMLRYNLAVTYVGMSEPEKAIETVQAGLLRNSEHASSHLLLGALFADTGERIPSLFAMMRFLILEPNSARTAPILGKLHNVLTSGVTSKETTEEGGMEINISLSGMESEEGDFMVIDMMLGLTLASLLTDSLYADAATVEKMGHVLDRIFTMLGETKSGKRGFTADYYAPFFIALNKEGHTEAFTYYISFSDDEPEIAAWFANDENEEKVTEFLEWVEEYEWAAEE